MIKLKNIMVNEVVGVTEIATDTRETKVLAFERSLQQKYSKVLDDLMFYYDSFSEGIFLSDLYIKKEFKEQGYDTKIMNDLVAYADTNKMPISLIPIAEHMPTRKLVAFYKRFGFVENNGNQLFDRSTMYRLPK